MGSDLPPLDWHTFWGTWQVRPGWLLVGVLLAAGYLLAWGRGRRHGGGVPVWRLGCFLGAVALVLLTFCSAVDAYAMALFWMHMVEHLTLIMVVPALLVAGHPLTVIRDALTGGLRQRYNAVVGSRVLQIPFHPIPGFLLYAGVIFLTHLTGFMDQMAMTPWMMTAEQVLYVVTGWIYLTTILGEEPIRSNPPYLARIGLILLGMVPDTVVGIVLLQADHDPFPMYSSMRPAWAVDGLRDAQIGGALMWVCGDGLMMCFGVALVITLVSGRTRDRVLGTWLEGVRRSTLAAEVDRSRSGSHIGRDSAVDDDDDALAAYNAMLARMNQGEHRHPRD